MSLRICPFGQRLLRQELHESSYVRRTQTGPDMELLAYFLGGWISSRPTMRSLLRSVASVPGGEYVLVFLSRQRVIVFPFGRDVVCIVCLLRFYSCSRSFRAFSQCERACECFSWSSIGLQTRGSRYLCSCSCR